MEHYGSDECYEPGGRCMKYVTSGELSTHVYSFLNVVNLAAEISEQAAAIPGDDIAEFRDAVAETWPAWDGCLESAVAVLRASGDGPFDDFDVAAECTSEEADFKVAYTALYDAVR